MKRKAPYKTSLSQLLKERTDGYPNFIPISVDDLIEIRLGARSAHKTSTMRVSRIPRAYSQAVIKHIQANDYRYNDRIFIKTEVDHVLTYINLYYRDNGLRGERS